MQLRRCYTCDTCHTATAAVFCNLVWHSTSLSSITSSRMTSVANREVLQHYQEYMNLRQHSKVVTASVCQQGTGKDGIPGAGAGIGVGLGSGVGAGTGSGSGSGSGAAQHGPAAPASTPRPDSSSPEGWSQQGSGMGGEGQGGGPLQELVSSMKAGQLGHKMNDTDILNQLVRLLLQ